MGRSQEYVVIRVTTSQDYIFDLNAIDGRTPDEIVKEFFVDASLNSHHATRDGSVIGNSRKLVKAVIQRTR